jgi:hypothetical protein
VIVPAIGLGIGAAVAAAVAVPLVRHRPVSLITTNHAGERVPAVLGIGLVAGIVTGGFALFISLIGLVALAAIVVLFVTGLVDDLSVRGERGFAEHLRTIRRLRPSTGILKLGAGVAAAAILAVLLGGGPVRVVAAALTMAVTTNVWNALDVRPGRTLKWSVLALTALAAASWSQGYGQLAAPALGASLALLPIDLRERGMLGDAGSNPLGFVVGLGLAVVLPTPWLIGAAVVALLLQVAAETVTISRLIDGVPPLRWFDRLGRRKETDRRAEA